ncbi:helix-turn-helix domain-containing protein [Desulfotruncus alcoholivorax]|uniref:helix-turn-helix domain-containing protein n=1 Tax=Desulfotruncus alcoholivorax TaxID=265477 RepID=UPI00042054D6|nr:helix-turn-helix domain-containing protein [Desulfotruncus alcoholivorax]
MANGEAKKDVTGLDIKIMLLQKGIRLKAIAHRAGVTPSAVSRALDDNTPYVGRRLRPVIADALGVPEEKLWPITTMPQKAAQ